ncbi:MAG: BrnT family toxin [Spirochaetales bacterium]|nr:BrnT family toxin [Spirochaetales bacterium]
MGKTIISDDGRFEWDEEKNAINKKKHGVGFEEITDVFDDPYFLVRYDKRHSIDEDRWNGIGCINGILILVTTFTERDRIRIISAQRADSRLKEVYYDYIKKIN